MRRISLVTAALGLAALLTTAASARDKGKPEPAACGDYGTSVHFEKTPSDAAKRAQKEEKLVFVLHVSGDFEKSELTWNNAEALRVNALADPEVGKYLEKYFVSSFQRVGTFRIVQTPNGPVQKQGGNVASYFCAPDGRVLHVIAGPVDGKTLLREAKWVVDAAMKAMKEAKGDGAAFKASFRKVHAEKLRTEHGLAVQPVTYDPPTEEDNQGALTYRDPTGRPLAPKLPPVPIDGPDVKFRYLQETVAARAAGAAPVADRAGRRWVLGNQGRVHLLLAAHSMQPIEKLFGSIFEGILGEQITTRPVQVISPFPWHGRGPNGGQEKVRPNG